MRPRRIPGLPDCPECNATVEELVHIAPGIATAKPCGCVFAPGEFFPDSVLEADYQRELVTDGGNQCAECGVTTRGAFLVEVNGDLLCEDCAGERECVRCGRPTEETTLAGDPKCRPCQTRKRRQSTSREAGQGSLGEFATDQGDCR